MSDTNTPKTTVELGIEAVQAGEVDKARELFDLARRQEPDNSEAWRWSASTAETEPERVQYFERAFFLAPENRQIADSLEIEGVQIGMIHAIMLLGLIRQAGEPYTEWILERDEARIPALFEELTQDEQLREVAKNPLVQKLMIARLDEFIRPSAQPAANMQQFITLDDMPASQVIVTAGEEQHATEPPASDQPRTVRIPLFGLGSLLRRRTTVRLEGDQPQTGLLKRIGGSRATAKLDQEGGAPDQAATTDQQQSTQGAGAPEESTDHLLDTRIPDATQPQQQAEPAPPTSTASGQPERIGLGDFALPSAPAAIPAAHVPPPVPVVPRSYPRWQIWRYGWFWWLVTILFSFGFVAWALWTSPFSNAPAIATPTVAPSATSAATAVPAAIVQPTLAPTSAPAATAVPAQATTAPQPPSPTTQPTAAPTAPPPTVAPSATAAAPPAQATATMPRRLITSPTSP